MNVLQPLLRSFIQRIAGTDATTLQPPRLKWVSVGPCVQSGDVFCQWLREGLASGKIPVNHWGACVHVIPEGMVLVSPQIFKVFTQHEWKQAQQHFLKLALHRKHPDGGNFWVYQIRSRKRACIKGLWIDNPKNLLGFELPESNPCLSLMGAA